MKLTNLNQVAAKYILRERTTRSIKNWGNRSILGNVVIGDTKTLEMYSPTKNYLKATLPTVKEKPIFSPRVISSNYFSPAAEKRHSLYERNEKEEDMFKTTS